jgi:ligand-binding sensor domain-containing protein/signal transduction histidine kinase
MAVSVNWSTRGPLVPACTLALTIVLSCPAAARAGAVGPSRVFERFQQLHWQEQDGLPQNTVLTITTTRDGYLWLGTYEGAVRFDGKRFAVFRPADTPQIGNQQVSALLEDSKGDLWLATYGGGLTRLSHGYFTRYTTRDGLSSDYLRCLFEDRDGNLWIGTNGGGLSRWRDGRFTRYTTDQGLPSNEIGAIIQDGRGALWVGTARGLAELRGGRFQAFVEDHRLTRAHVLALEWTGDGALWAGASDSGLYRIVNRRVRHFGSSDGLTSNRVERLHVDSDDHVWVGTEDQGLFRLSNGRLERYGTEHGLPGRRVPAIAPGVDGDLWVGTNGGLVRLRASLVDNYTVHDGLAAEGARSIYQDAGGRIWVGSTRGLSRFEHGRFVVLTTKDGLPSDDIVSIARGADETAWIHTREGLVRHANGRFVPGPDLGGIPARSVNTVLQGRGGALWIGTGRDGLARLHDGRVTRYTRRDGLADDTVLSLYEDRAGSVWIGTLRGGVTRIDAQGRLQSWSTREGLASDHVKAFYEDGEGTMWIGGGGLSRFKNGTLAPLSSRQGLFNDTVFQILEDDDGNLWMNCNVGISRTSIEELNDVADGRVPRLTSFGYGAADGMLSSEGVGAPSAGWRMRDGTMWFPTIRGVVVLDPRHHDKRPPRVVIESVAVDGRVLPADGTVRLSPGEENLEIQYTGLSWNRPQAVRFRYRLAGLDSHWVEAGTRRTAYYSHVPAGAYTFSVIADNGEGVWSPEGRGFSLVVLPPFYRTWWFVTLIAAGLVGSAAVAHRRRIRRLTRQHAAQEAFSRRLIGSQEQERKRIAGEIHDSLGQSLAIIKNRALLGIHELTDPDAARDQFTRIAAQSAQAIDEAREISFNLRPYLLDRLGLTKALVSMIQKVAAASGVRFTTAIGDLDGFFAPDDEIHVYRIVQECLNNVVKHAGATQATVGVTRDAVAAVVTISDDGHGFAHGAEGGEGGSGLGLTSIHERARLLGADPVIESSPDRGTRITIRFGRPPGAAGVRDA